MIQVESLFEDEDFRVKVTREEFEMLCQDLIDRVGKVVRDALNSASMTMVRNGIVLSYAVVVCCLPLFRLLDIRFRFALVVIYLFCPHYYWSQTSDGHEAVFSRTRQGSCTLWQVNFASFFQYHHRVDSVFLTYVTIVRIIYS